MLEKTLDHSCARKFERHGRGYQPGVHHFEQVFFRQIRIYSLDSYFWLTSLFKALINLSSSAFATVRG